jgi:hypothetical protein
MENIQLRWLKRPTGKTIMDEWGYYQPEMMLVLQYRTMYTETIYTTQHEYADVAANQQQQSKWGEWRDVPTVFESGETK